MKKAKNDATLQQIGTIYQYIIALKDCFELNGDDLLEIEKNGDISVINDKRGIFQKEVKHHLGKTYLSDRDIGFWKTLVNWYEEYDRIKNFPKLILSTTSIVSDNSIFMDWNTLDKNEKLNRLKKIGNIQKKCEKHFRKYYNIIFNDLKNENKILDILDKFIIESGRENIKGISNSFSKYIGYIPKNNRDGYIAALLGQIVALVKDPPYKWEVNKEIFEDFLQTLAPSYIESNFIPLPIEFARKNPSDEEKNYLVDKIFINKIKEIDYDSVVSRAITDYWKTDMTIINYFKDNPLYLQSLDSYRATLEERLFYNKEEYKLKLYKEDGITLSKNFYNSVMLWEPIDFESIKRNQDFFQRGIVHNIMDETDLNWKVEKEYEY